MRTGLVLAVGLALVGCSHERDGATGLIRASEMLAFNACKADAPALPSEDWVIRQANGRVRRDGRTLHVGAARLTDNLEDGGDHAQYRYVGRLAEAPIDLFHVALYEGESWTIVDQQGRVIDLGGAPLIGPDPSVFAVLANGEPHYGSSVSVHGLGSAGPGTLLQVEAPPPCGGRWANPDVFSFWIYTAATDIDPNAPLAPARLVRENGVWRYEGPQP